MNKNDGMIPPGTQALYKQDVVGVLTNNADFAVSFQIPAVARMEQR